MILRILSILCLLSFIGEAKIFETTTIEDIIPLVDHEAWLVLDLDNTVYEGKQALGHTEWFYDKAFAMMREGGLTIEEATRECYPEWIEIQKVCPVKPVEEAFIPALKKLQGNVIMGLTHRQPSIADSTIRQLESIGLSFYLTAPVKHSFEVPSLTPTLYTEGVLFTGEYNKKGEIFLRFLAMIGQKPKKIVFVDDKKGHVEDVGRAVEGEGIEYIGVHYRAIEHAEKVYDPKIAEFQKKFLNQIMSNEAARLLIENEIDS